MNTQKNWSIEVRIIGFIGALISILALIWFFRGVISPLVIAALFAYVMSPIADYLLKKTRFSRPTAVVIVYIVTLLIFLAIPAVVVPIVVNQVQAMNLDLVVLVENYEAFVTNPIYVMQWTIYPNQFLPEIQEVPANLLNPVAEFTLGFVESFTTNFIWILVVFVSIYYFLIDGHRLVHWLIRVVPEDYRPDYEHLVAQLRHVWSDYLRSQLAFMFVVGLVDSIVWLAIGLPGAIFLGFLTGLTSFVHEIGAVVSGVVSVSVALLVGSHFLPMSNIWFAVLVLACYLILTAVKNVWIRPVIVGRHVHLHSGVVFVIILAALVFYGALAAFIAVPVFVSLLVIGRYLRRRILGLPPFPDGVDPADYFSFETENSESKIEEVES
jgi:predicted PurR-regulated permease PerM